MPFQPGQLVENRLLNGSVIVCRVVEKLTRPGMEGMFRLTDARETATDRQLIARGRTWAAPVENIVPHDAECLTCHKDGLVYAGALQ